MTQSSKRTIKRFVIRFSLLSVVVIGGAVAIAQMQRGSDGNDNSTASRNTSQEDTRKPGQNKPRSGHANVDNQTSGVESNTHSDASLTESTLQAASHQANNSDWATVSTASHEESSNYPTDDREPDGPTSYEYRDHAAGTYNDPTEVSANPTSLPTLPVQSSDYASESIEPTLAASPPDQDSGQEYASDDDQYNAPEAYRDSYNSPQIDSSDSYDTDPYNAEAYNADPNTTDAYSADQYDYPAYGKANTDSTDASFQDNDADFQNKGARDTYGSESNNASQSELPDSASPAMDAYQQNGVQADTRSPAGLYDESDGSVEELPAPLESTDTISEDSTDTNGYSSDNPRFDNSYQNPQTAPSTANSPRGPYDGIESNSADVRDIGGSSDGPVSRQSASSAGSEPYSTRDNSQVSDLRSAESTGIESTGIEATGTPGPTELEGPQTATLTVEKSAPTEIQVDKPTTVTIKIRNVGTVAAHDVLIRDEIPAGTRLMRTNPQADQAASGGLLWQMGTIKPGDEVTATMELIPRMEGQIGSVATVSFQTTASARSVATKPRLELVQTAPRQVLIGDEFELAIQVSNPGTGSATNVYVEEDVPLGLMHPAGRELEHEIGTLRPGASRQLALELTADEPGLVENVLVARAEGGLSVEERVTIEVIAPALELNVQGPSRRYLGREATFEVSVANPGTAPAKDIDLTLHLPRGLAFVSTNKPGFYDKDAHTVHWNLEELPAGELGTVELVTLSEEMGQHKLRLDGKAEMNLSDAVELPFAVEGLAALSATVTDVTDPVEIGGQTTYEVRVVNQGSKAAFNIRLGAQLPTGLKPVDGKGPTRAIVTSQQVEFAAMPRLNSKTDVTYKIHVEATEAGDQRFKVFLQSEEMTEPVVMEESTRVYADD